MTPSQTAAQRVLDTPARVQPSPDPVPLPAQREPGRRRRAGIILGVAVTLVGMFDAWLWSCGFHGCPTPAEIRSFRPTEGSKVYDRSGKFLGRLTYVRRVNVPLSRVPPHVRQAFLATEDRRFYEHNGLDWRAVGRALVRNVKALGVREGFSTITRQVARNTFTPLPP